MGQRDSHEGDHWHAYLRHAPSISIESDWDDATSRVVI